MAPMDLPPPQLRIAAESESLAEEKESLISLWLFSENRVSWRAYCGIWRRRIGVVSGSYE
jgi:hypothetical protein